jgi:hypothetical protein
MGAGSLRSMEGFDMAQASADLTRSVAAAQQSIALLLRRLRGLQGSLLVLSASTALYGAVQVRDRAWLAAGIAATWIALTVVLWRILTTVRRIVSVGAEGWRIADKWRLLYEDAIGLKPKP